MNLLTDGMIEKSVIKTPLNKQLRIDNHTASTKPTTTANRLI